MVMMMIPQYFFFLQTIVIPSPCGSLAQVFVQGALAKILFTGGVAKVSTVTDFASCSTGDDDKVTRCMYMKQPIM